MQAQLMRWAGALVLVNALTAAPVRAHVKTRSLSWTADGQTYEGKVVFDPAKVGSGKLPAVLIVHQYMGPTDYEMTRATMLAELGYVAMVADVYGVTVRPKDRKEAGEAATRLKTDRVELRKRLQANLAQLLAQPEVNTAHVAAIGYCFGGTAVLELARAGADLDGVVSFHGGLDSPSPADGKNIKAKVLILHGAADPFVKKPDIEAFIAELDAAKVDWQKVDYAGAVHAFTEKHAGDDPSKGAAYNEKADRRSWDAMRAFLTEAPLRRVGPSSLASSAAYDSAARVSLREFAVTSMGRTSAFAAGVRDLREGSRSAAKDDEQAAASERADLVGRDFGATREGHEPFEAGAVRAPAGEVGDDTAAVIVEEGEPIAGRGDGHGPPAGVGRIRRDGEAAVAVVERLV